MSRVGWCRVALLGGMVAAVVGCSGAGAAGSPPDGGTATDSATSNDAVDVRPDAGSSDGLDAHEPAWTPLFNGVDFAGWDRFLGKPSPAEAPLGIDNDPRAVYTIVAVDGEPAIRISGEVWGALISKAEFCNFHLRGQYKWGTKSWPPLNFLDSGIMYMSTGPLGAVNAGGAALSDPIGSGGFMVSMEYQLTPVDSGGMYNLGPIAFAQLSRFVPHELPNAWNQVDIIVGPDAVTHRLNGEEIASGGQFRLTWPGQAATALRCGKLQVQSEGGEIFFRRLEIQVLP